MNGYLIFFILLLFFPFGGIIGLITLLIFLPTNIINVDNSKPTAVASYVYDENKINRYVLNSQDDNYYNFDAYYRDTLNKTDLVIDIIVPDMVNEIPVSYIGREIANNNDVIYNKSPYVHDYNETYESYSISPLAIIFDDYLERGTKITINIDVSKYVKSLFYFKFYNNNAYQKEKINGVCTTNKDRHYYDVTVNYRLSDENIYLHLENGTLYDNEMRSIDNAIEHITIDQNILASCK